MFDPQLNQNNQQNSVNPYQDRSPYINALSSVMMPAQTQNSIYPYQGSNQASPYPQSNPQLSQYIDPYNSYPPQASLPAPEYSQDSIGRNSFAEGGQVEGGQERQQFQKPKKQGKNNPYPALAEMIRQQGKGEDTMLAHINPLEAMILQNLGGSGTINPKTGLHQFGIGNLGKWLKSNIGPALGTIIGNMILPGVGGAIGGALGGAAGSKMRRRNDMGQASLRGAAIGAGAPTISSILGSGASALGAQGAGSYLSNYGTQNAILPSLSNLLGMGGGSSSAVANPLSAVSSINGLSGNAASNGQMSVSAGGSSLGSSSAAQPDFMDSLLGNTKTFLTDPKNLLATGVVANSFFNRPKEKKEKSPEQLADEQKRYENNLMLSPEQLVQKERYLLQQEQMKRRISRNKYLPEERINVEPLYVRTNTPEEYRRQNKWLNYYDNPQFSGNPTLMKEGGSVGGIRQDLVSKLLAESIEIIKNNKLQHNNLLNEPSLNKELTQLMSFYKQNYGLTQAEDDEVSRKGYDILRKETFDDAENRSTKATLMKEGGMAQPSGMYEMAEMQSPMGLGQFLEGRGGGQDDNVRMNLPENSYIIDASTVSNLGDGNSHAGAKKIEALISNGEFYVSPEGVSGLGKGNPAVGSQMLDKLIKNVRKHKGGSTKLPPKAKSLADYMR